MRTLQLIKTSHMCTHTLRATSGDRGEGSTNKLQSLKWKQRRTEIEANKDGKNESLWRRRRRDDVTCCEKKNQMIVRK
jgi:hypothetical protein